MEVKTQEPVLKLISACVVIISIQRNEQNTLELYWHEIYTQFMAKVDYMNRIEQNRAK